MDPVIGNRPDDRQPGAAVGAVDEGVAVSAVRRSTTPQTIAADSHVRRDMHLAFSLFRWR